MVNSTGNTYNNLRKQAKTIKQRKDAGICMNKKENAIQEKIIIKFEEINQKVLAKEGRLSSYRLRVKQYGENKTFENERKFYQQLEEDDTERYQHNEKD